MGLQLKFIVTFHYLYRNESITVMVGIFKRLKTLSFKNVHFSVNSRITENKDFVGCMTDTRSIRKKVFLTRKMAMYLEFYFSM